MKNYIKIIIASLLLASFGNSAEVKAVTDKPYEWRIFASVGAGVVVAQSRRAISIPKEIQYTSYKNITSASILGGSELIFQNGHGLNFYGGYDGKAAVVGANYVYESTSPIKWAVFSGLDGGIMAYEDDPKVTNMPAIGTMRYNLGVRLRKNRHAISFNVKIPLFASTINYGSEEIPYNIIVYTGVAPTIKYTYFFGL